MRARRTRLAAGGILVLILAAGVFFGRVWERRWTAAAQVAPVTSAESTDGSGGTSAAAAEPANASDNASATTADPTEASDTSRDEGRRSLIVDRVGLSAEQETRVDSVVDHYRDLMRQLRADYRTGYRALVDSTRAAITATLTPEQASHYDSLLAEFDRRRDREREDDRGRNDGRGRSDDRGRDGRERDEDRRRDDDRGRDGRGSDDG